MLDTMEARKNSMKEFANKYALSFWKGGKPRIRPAKENVELPTKYKVDFPDDVSRKNFEAEMTKKRDKMDKELKAIRWGVVMMLYGGSETKKGKVAGYGKKDSVRDMKVLQEKYWAEQVKEAVEKSGGTFTEV